MVGGLAGYCSSVRPPMKSEPSWRELDLAFGDVGRREGWMFQLSEAPELKMDWGNNVQNRFVCKDRDLRFLFAQEFYRQDS